ncbi:hypothetical protein Unana1_08504 [Umbelopsis nana]
MFTVLRQISIVIALATVVRGSVTSISGTFEIISPAPNAIFVAGQILPVIYSLSNDIAVSKSLQLAIFLSPNAGNNLNTTTMTIAPNADVSPSGKSTMSAHNITYYEHPVNFPIPNNAPNGMYDVIFFDKLQQTNTTIPVTIRPEAQTPSPSQWFSPSQTNLNNLNKDGSQPSSFLASNNALHTLPALYATLFVALMSVLLL